MKAILLGLAAFISGAAAAPVPDGSFSFDTLDSMARELAGKPYERAPSPVPEWLRKLSYDQYRDIRFNPVKSWWNLEPQAFRLQFFHPGYLFDRTVQISELVNGQARPIPFSSRLFDYGHNRVGPMPADMGYAGFRIHNNLNQPGDELGVFQGASYFRFLCRRAVYGMSSRAVAIDTAEPGGEEFPDFERFWVEEPGRGATQIVVYALLNGPSVTGAYRFGITPGDDTVMRIHAVLYCRKNPAVLGLAPLTSMYWHGTESDFESDDYRPEVHDSDGLMVHTGAGEWLWRPLSNPRSPQVMAFMDENPRGFGLVQRQRNFENYQDIEASYQLRPSTWIEPLEDWGPGSVRLVELHAPDETGDNIVAFWVPDHLPAPGTPIVYDYDLHWFMDQIRPNVGATVGTRLGRSRTFETDLERFLVDFDGPALRRLDADSPVKAVVTVGSGATLVHTTVEKNPYNGTWRAAFAIKPDGSGHPVELRCFLRRPAQALTETWTYLWQP